MTDALEITAVRLSPLSSDEVTPDMRHGEIEWWRLEIAVCNRSRSERYCAISGIHRIHYDDDGTLAVALTAPAGERDYAPGYVCLDPGAEATITTRISSPITFVEEPPRAPRTARRVRLPDDVGAIRCVIAYDARPPTPAFPGRTVSASYVLPRAD